jgi:hypothetical protein
MALISADPQVMHGQAVIAGTRLPGQRDPGLPGRWHGGRGDRRRIPRGQYCGRAAAAAYGAALAREELLPLPQSR